MQTNKRNRSLLKSGTPSPVENKKPNMATSNNSELIDTIDLQLGALGEQGVLYNALMKVCDGINSIDKNTKAIKRSVEKLYNKVDDINKRLEVLEGTKAETDRQIQEIKTKQETFEGEIITVKTMVESLAEQDSPMKEPFDPEFTVIANNIPATEHEDIDTTAERLIIDGTRTPDVQVVRTKRLVSRNQFPGLVKIELASVKDKISVLRNKKNLAENQEFRRVYLRSSKPHSDRIAEFNFKKLLRRLPNGSDFRIGGNGRIIHKNDQPDSQTLHRGLHGELQGAQGQSPNIARLPTPLSMMSDDFQEEASTYTTQRRFSPGTTE